ncbi:hypothetical protein D9M71_657700 [compost metagenome]
MWRVAQPGIGAALPAHAQLTVGAGGQDQFQFATVYLGFTKIFIAVGQGGGQLGLLLRRQAVEFQAFLVQVVAIGDLPVQAHLPRLQAFAAEHEGLVDWQEIALGKGVGLAQAA